MTAAQTEPRASSGPSEAGWYAQLELGIESDAERSFIRKRRHVGPLLVQRAFYPEPNGCCHVYLIHPPGGIVGGDRLELSVDVGEHARALLTTPAATKLYRSSGPRSLVEQRFRLAEGACLEWMPQETIAFSGSVATVTTRVELCREASFLGWEVACLGRRACGEEFARGHFEQRLELERDGKPLLKERLSLRGSGVELRAPWGMAGRTCQGTLLAVGPREFERELVETIRSEVTDADGLFAATLVGDVLLCRFLGDQGLEARRVLNRVWEIVRPELSGWPAVAPRIWAT